jgi:crotonobetainyl-CoA:carnitine CoA-transferase CaiB-like acyl-CoA transferase
MAGPLDGCSVVDLSMYVAAPLATLMLAEQGANVIKVEPVGGEAFRYGTTSRAGLSAWWLSTNRSKRSVALNIKDPQGAKILRQLIAGADVFVHQFRPGVIQKLGFDWKSASELNERLIYAEMSGFGQTGSLARRRAYDNCIQSFVGMPFVQGWGNEKGPQSIKTPIADKVAPLIFAQAITAALYERDRSGIGQHIDVSMVHSLLWWMWGDMYTDETFLEPDGVVRGTNVRELGNLLFPTSDGYITVTFATDSEWFSIATALEKPEWISDPQLGDGLWRDIHRGEVFSLLARSFAGRTTEEWSRRLAETDAPFSPVHEPKEVLKDPYVVELEMTQVLDHPVAGPHLQPTSPARFSRTPGAATSAPVLGDSTESVLLELGYTQSEIKALAESGVVGIADGE